MIIVCAVNMQEDKATKKTDPNIITLRLLPGQKDWIDKNKPRILNRTQFIQSLIDKAMQEQQHEQK